jgi:hypothetical protein
MNKLSLNELPRSRQIIKRNSLHLQVNNDHFLSATKKFESTIRKLMSAMTSRVHLVIGCIIHSGNYILAIFKGKHR